MIVLRRVLLRLLAGVAVLWGAATLTFVGLNVTGGDPALAILGGPDAMPTAEALAQVRREYGLDQPLVVQYASYLGRLAQGDLGESYRLRIPVTRAIGEHIGATVWLALWAALVAVLLSVVVATLTARRGRHVGALSSGTELVLSSMPSFVLGILLLLVFSFQLRLLPPTGSSGWKTMVLPTLTLALPVAAVLTQVLRQELEDILEQPFIMMARARGLSEAGVRLGHALRHALIPLVTLSGFILASLLGGAVITETLFARQGVGRLMLDAANGKDVPMVLGITLLAALIYVVVNLVVDLLLPLIDPRVNAR
ncbi:MULTISPECIES: ABC transporter permease [unclassified Pseudomonas]|jgi:peptide/nickel transport system permease protein|uniref:ABC transporter permease n=1 Tax=unclassified Pseudomonas TaxID=196821 RepID=UPI002448A3A8|nr:MULTISPECIES: ABC transporter permease [unclassified Pseudomonas]MDG9927267.1 ABC transporter permease [Pseudomonas sp. GD04042]MDH0485260.1 ABC transporter permease [Pseudomonas sp. GD04015]MDH0602689.1 ABC transporter permease [Pseudomonas sp. GD03869]MDH0895367.1 ABC transporter permease [Pseudomonas sp. GD03875]MDH1067821.1 ABC transporter permease [Pseudomonas sp. GD03985]